MTTNPDAIVVGAGIVGAACAYYLATAGMRVLVLDSDFPGSGVSAAAMGHLVVMDDSAEQLALTSYSRDLWDELRPELSAACEFDACGTLWLAEDGEQVEVVHDKHTFYQRHGISTEVLDAQAVSECEPELRRPLAGALRVPGDSTVYPPAAVLWLLQRARDFGAVIRSGCRVTAINDQEVVTDAMRARADVIINAAGPQAVRLTPDLPVVPRKGHLAITDRYPGFCRHQLVELGYLASAHGLTAESVAFNLQPRLTGQVLIGSSRELVGWDASINRAIVQKMLSRAIDFVPGIAALNTLRIWTGFRPATMDKLPLIGRWPGTAGLWIAAGHEGLGVTTSLGTGRMLADLILGRPTAIDSSPFAPDRADSAQGARA